MDLDFCLRISVFGFLFLDFCIWISLVGKPLVTDARVPGRILGHHVYYEKVGAEPYIVQTVKEGYRCRIGFLAAWESYSLC